MEYATPLISVIVPVYNAKEYLVQCLDSIISQTYKNLEIILVDDGSHDDSGKICDNYALRDARIVVIHQENRGVAQARNRGIDAARGQYITFVDSDDWIDDMMFATMIEALSQYGVQSVMCSYVREYPGKSLPKYVCPEDKVFESATFQRRLCGLVGEELSNPENLDCYNTMWGKIYPAEAVKGIVLTDLAFIGSSEDLLFNLKAFSKIQGMVYINRCFYHYRKLESNSVSSQYKPKLEKQWNNLYEEIEQVVCCEKSDAYVEALNNRIAINVLGIGLNCITDNASFLEKCKRLTQSLSNEKRITALKKLPLKFMPFYWKLFFIAAKHRQVLVLCVLLIIIKKMKGKI